MAAQHEKNLERPRPPTTRTRTCGGEKAGIEAESLGPGSVQRFKKEEQQAANSREQRETATKFASALALLAARGGNERERGTIFTTPKSPTPNKIRDT